MHAPIDGARTLASSTLVLLLTAGWLRVWLTLVLA